MSLMEITLRPANDTDCEFAFEAKKQALGPHVVKRWGWDDAFQRDLHGKRWQERPWQIILLSGKEIGTLSVAQWRDHIQLGEFYLLPQFQSQGIGSSVLQSVLRQADILSLPVRLEYLKWNPVGSLYKPHGFVLVEENDIHYFLCREPLQISKPA